MIGNKMNVRILPQFLEIYHRFGKKGNEIYIKFKMKYMSTKDV